MGKFIFRPTFFLANFLMLNFILKGRGGGLGYAFVHVLYNVSEIRKII